MEKTNRKIIRRITERRQAKEKRHRSKKTKCMSCRETSAITL
jgi:hypothetical protein